MPLQTISSGAFKFATIKDNQKQIAIAGTMNISVDDDNEISGDFRIHDAITPGGLPTPPAGTLTYMLTEKVCHSQTFVATTDGENSFSANTTLYGPFIQDDNVRVFLTANSTDPNDEFEIDPLKEAYTIHYGTSHVTIDTAEFTNQIKAYAANNITGETITHPTKIRLQWLDDRVNGGIREKDGWHFCDGRTLKKDEYAALYKAIGQSWNNMLEIQEVIKDGFDLSINHPFNEIKIIEGNSLFTNFDVNYDENEPDNLIAYRRSPTQVQADTWETAERLVEGVHYTKSGGNLFTTTVGNVLDTRWEILILTKKPSDVFQIPDLRGYYLRSVGSWDNRDTTVSGNPQKYGIRTRQEDTIKKHSHFLSFNSAGEHSHSYTPWLYDPDTCSPPYYNAGLSMPNAGNSKNADYNKLKAVRRGVGKQWYYSGDKHRNRLNTVYDYSGLNTTISSANAGAGSQNVWVNESGNRAYSGWFTNTGASSNALHAHPQNGTEYNRWTNWSNPYFTRNETKDFYALLGPNNSATDSNSGYTGTDVARNYNYAENILRPTSAYEDGAPIYASEYYIKSQHFNQHHPIMSKNKIEPRYFLLGGGPSDPIKPEDKFHYHEISTQEPDASFNNTSDQGSASNAPHTPLRKHHTEVDMPHIKLPIFIKY